MARAGVEPTTLRLKAIDSTNAPSRPTMVIIIIIITIKIGIIVVVVIIIILSASAVRMILKLTAFEWVRFWCLARSEALLKAFVQPWYSHMYGFSPVWDRRWVLRFSRREYALWHPSNWKRNTKILSHNTQALFWRLGKVHNHLVA